MKKRDPRLLVIDDDTTWLKQVPMILEDTCDVDGYQTIDQGLKALENQFYDIIILDLNFEGDSRTGFDVFTKIHATDSGTDIIIISGETNPQRLIQIMNAGATQFIAKPATPTQVREAVEKTLHFRAIRNKIADVCTDPENKNEAPLSLIGSSVKVQKLREEVKRAIESNAKDILLTGETGTGKEVVAKLIAYQSDPSNRLIPLHCAAISDGIAESEFFGHTKGAFTGADRDRVGAFEAAKGGFIFLDEIGDMPLPQQAKLLRVLQERKVQRVGSLEERNVNFRCISATHVDLEKAVIQKTFREDLFYRISKTSIHLPSLKDRIEDLPELTHYFLSLEKHSKRISITNEALELLQTYSWPGNIRQLKAVIYNVSLRCSKNTIREKDICQVLPEVAKASSSRNAKALVGRYGASLVNQERRRFKNAIIRADGNRSNAAKDLGISRATFFRRAKELGLVKEYKLEND